MFNSQSCRLLKRQLQAIFEKGEGQKVPVKKYFCMGCPVMDSSSVEMHSLDNPMLSRAQTQDNLILSLKSRSHQAQTLQVLCLNSYACFPCGCTSKQCSDPLYLGEGITSQMLISTLEKSLETKRQQEGRRLSYH